MTVEWIGAEILQRLYENTPLRRPGFQTNFESDSSPFSKPKSAKPLGSLPAEGGQVNRHVGGGRDLPFLFRYACRAACSLFCFSIALRRQGLNL